MGSTEGCMKGATKQFGKYIGNWDIQSWQLSKDGKTWSEASPARWDFRCIGNGIAVQDFWMPEGGNVGTNLRIYDPKTESWDITWTASKAPGVTRITAREHDNGNIIMHYISPTQQPPRRITFFPLTESGWDWVLEMSYDAEKTWIPVFKIKATPAK